MYAVQLLLVLLGLAEHTIANSKKYDNSLLYRNQRQNDYTYANNKVNMNELHLLRKYDQLLSSMKQKSKKKKDLLYGDQFAKKRVSGGSMKYSTQDNDAVINWKNNDQSRKSKNIVKRKSYNQIKNWRKENDHSVENGDAIESNNGIKANMYTRMKDGSKEKDGLNNAKPYDEFKHKVTANDGTSTSYGGVHWNDFGMSKKYQDRASNLNDDEMNYWSNEADNILGTNDYKNAKDLWNEADDFWMKNTEKDESRAKKSELTDRPNNQWDKRNGKGIIESIEHTLGIRSKKKRNVNEMFMDPLDVMYDGKEILQNEKSKKEQKENDITVYTKKSSTNPKSNGAAYRPWIKQNDKKIRKDGNIGEKRFVNHDVTYYWMPLDEAIVTRKSKAENGMEKDDKGDSSLIEQSKKRVSEKITKRLEDDDNSLDSLFDKDISEVVFDTNEIGQREKKEIGSDENEEVDWMVGANRHIADNSIERNGYFGKEKTSDIKEKKKKDMHANDVGMRQERDRHTLTEKKSSY